MGKIKIIRKASWIGKSRSIKVYIDGEFVDTLLPGEVKEFCGLKDSVEVQIKKDWYKSNVERFNTIGNEVELTVNWSKKVFYYPFLVLLLYNVASKILMVPFFVSIVSVILVVILFELFIGRTQYLKIKRNNE